MIKLVAASLEEGSSLDMMKEEEKLLAAPPSTPYLRVYLMDNPSITYGHFIKPEKWLYLPQVLKKNISLAKRPTGGGLLFHGHDLAFSLSIPPTHFLFQEEPLSRYQLINKSVFSVIQAIAPSLNFLSLAEKDSQIGSEKEVCLAHITLYDLQINGKKIGGSAQRKTKNSLLHQGYLHLFPIDKTPYEELLIDSSLWDKIERFSTPLFPAYPQEKREGIAKIFQQKLTESLHTFL